MTEQRRYKEGDWFIAFLIVIVFFVGIVMLCAVGCKTVQIVFTNDIPPKDSTWQH